MRVAIVNPYLDTLGGGERYTLMFAKALNELGYEIHLQWESKNILDKASSKFGMDFSFIKVTENVKRGDGYDLVFWISDGSIPLLRSRKNLLHFQVPFIDVNGNSLLNKMKLFRINKVLCNSFFTKRYIDKEFGVSSAVVYPPVDVKNIKPLKKENMILYVGRFSELLQSKRQDVLVDSFKKLLETKGMQNWKLVLAGSTDVGAGKEFAKLKKSVNHVDQIKIVENPDFSEILSLYGRSKFFWSAAGYDVDPKKTPQKMEHFGIAVVEALAGGSVPIIYSGGGHGEIIKEKENGILWTKRSELIKYTLDLINDKNEYERLQKNALKLSKMYSYENFKENVKTILE